MRTAVDPIPYNESLEDSAELVSSILSSSTVGCCCPFFWFPWLLGNNAGPISNLMGLLQSAILWDPFRFEGQAQRRHSPSFFLLRNSASSMPSIPGRLRFRNRFLEMGVGLINPVRVLPVALRAAIFRNRLESLKYSSHSLSIVSARLSSSRSLGVVDTPLGTLTSLGTGLFSPVAFRRSGI